MDIWRYRNTQPKLTLKYSNKTKQDTIDLLLERVIVSGLPKKVGIIIEKLPQKIRNILKELTSDDFSRRIKN